VSDIFDETEENLRADKWVAIVKSSLPIVGSVLGGALVLALGVWGFQSWQTNIATKASETYQEALETAGKGDMAGAKTKLLTVTTSGNAAYKSMAWMALGGLAQNDNNSAEAIKDFDKAASVAPSPDLKDMAVLKSVMLQIDTAKYDDIKARLTPLTGDKHPYAPLAKEALAIAKLQSGDVKGARSDLNVLTLTLGTPEGVKDRAGLLIQAIDSGAFPTAKAAMALPEAKAPAMQQMPGVAGPSQ
jgi:hypothetical protein